jgi:hypothetical protein
MTVAKSELQVSNRTFPSSDTPSIELPARRLCFLLPSLKIHFAIRHSEVHPMSKYRATGVIGTIALGTLISSLFAATVQAQVGFPLVCRSGGGMQLSWSSLANARTNFIAYYFRAPNAAGTNSALLSGQCAWVDRPLNAAEPTAMLWDLDATVGVRFKAYGSSTPVVAITGGLDLARAKLFVDYVRTSGNYFTATVYNSNAGYMVVTDFRGGH